MRTDRLQPVDVQAEQAPQPDRARLHAAVHCDVGVVANCNTDSTYWPVLRILPDQALVMEVRQGRCHTCLGQTEPTSMNGAHNAPANHNDGDGNTGVEGDESDSTS